MLIRSTSVKCVASMLKPLDFIALKNLCKAFHKFFKESKQYLLLGKSQSKDFDAQIADITLALMRYLLLSYYERTRYGITIGDLFRELAQASIQENLLADISEYFLELLKIFAEFAGIDFITFYRELLTSPKAAQIVDLLNIRSAFEKRAA